MDVIDWDFAPISKAGVYSNIPMQEYHGQLCVGPSISSSGLRTIFYQSPKHYFRDSYLNAKRKIDENASKPFMFGRAAHHLTLGEAEFRKFFAPRPLRYPGDKSESLFWTPSDEDPGKEWNSNSSWCRAWLGLAGYFRMGVLTPNDIENVLGMADSMSEDIMIQAGVLSGLIEHSFVWQDKETGIWLKWRPDAIPTDSMNFSDLKTTASIQNRDLERSVASYGYHMQAALGAMACREVLGRDMESFSLVFVEKTDPWCVRTKTIRDGDIALGERQVRSSLRLMAQCLETGVWPGPGGTQTDQEMIGLDEYADRRALSRIEEIERELVARENGEEDQ